MVSISQLMLLTVTVKAQVTSLWAKNVDCQLIPTPLFASVCHRIAEEFEVSGALSYSAGLSLLLENPFTCLHDV